MTTPPTTPSPSSEPGPGAGPADTPAVPYGTPPAAVPYGTAANEAAAYGGPAYGAAPTTDPAARPSRNALGIAALVLGVVVLLTSTVSLVVQASMMRTGDYVAIAAVLGVISLVQGALALAAIVCGGIGLARRGRAKGAAGVGLGIGITALWAVLGSVFFGVLMQVLA